ncbi:MAG TPA: type I secretion system permease/ATPase [Brevundimonas sp.]|uniref:type I secretion system permease/ATPase n=1 Tax=Brevundimonas sp. TaxID=1871086 RepID=UPI002B61377E|nr:type I secretion system permease/ATPase [Brevundimonas sp.]HRH19691.1 type I secretion system permease/ATPase [Brevundimonas sp.]
MLQALFPTKPGTEPLAAALKACRGHLLFAFGFSALVNVLYLAPTLYMMQVYDRVVPTGGILTLLFVTVVVVFALVTLAALDHIRARILVRAGLRMDRLLAGAVLNRVIGSKESGAKVAQAMRDFDSFRQALSGQGALALCDLPWTPVYLLICFMLHWTLGMLTLVGGGLLFGLAVLNERSAKPRIEASSRASTKAYVAQETIATQSEVVRALGMRQALITRQLKERSEAVTAQADAQFVGGRFSGAIKFLRLLLQSLALGAGAWLAVEGQISAGAIIAASVLLSRAVQPIELIVGAWSGIVQGRASWNNLIDLFAATADQDQARTLLPKPVGLLTLDGVGVRSPAGDTPLLRHVSLSLQPGESLGVVGPSGAGKTTLARLIAGATEPDVGTVRLDKADYATWDPERLARHIGYLPQDSVLFAGTVKENISRFDGSLEQPREDVDERAIKAARLAGCHDMILKLPHGYDTPLGAQGRGLSAGQAQRIALARALYGDPCLVVLDEPNSHLDGEGEAALAKALAGLRTRGATVIIVAHRSGVLQNVDKLLVLRDGAVEGLGPRNEIAARLQAGRQPAPRVVSSVN